MAGGIYIPGQRRQGNSLASMMDLYRTVQGFKMARERTDAAKAGLEQRDRGLQLTAAYNVMRGTKPGSPLWKEATGTIVRAWGGDPASIRVPDEDFHKSLDAAGKEITQLSALHARGKITAEQMAYKAREILEPRLADSGAFDVDMADDPRVKAMADTNKFMGEIIKKAGTTEISTQGQLDVASVRQENALERLGRQAGMQSDAGRRARRLARIQGKERRLSSATGSILAADPGIDQGGDAGDVANAYTAARKGLRLGRMGVTPDVTEGVRDVIGRVKKGELATFDDVAREIGSRYDVTDPKVARQVQETFKALGFGPDDIERLRAAKPAP